MPAKETLNNLSILIKSKFEEAEKASSQQELENCLTGLMKLVNNYYDNVKVYLEGKPNIEGFSFCKQNFSQIKSFIESRENLTNLTKKLHLEAWISALYSDVHALDLRIKTQEQLEELNKKIQDIGIDFKQLALATEKSSLKLIDESYSGLIEYVNNFGNTWKTKEKRLLADSHYNFALTLVENSNYPEAINYLEKSITFYKNAAEIASETDKNELLAFVKQTNKLLEKIKTENAKNLAKELIIRLKKLAKSSGQLAVVNEATLPQSTKKELQVTNVIQKDPFQIKGKRKSKKEFIHVKTKKVKIDPPSITKAKHPEIKFQPKKTETEREQLLTELEKIGIKNYKLGDPSQKSDFIRYKASVASKSAIEIIGKLSFAKKDLSDDEKLSEKAQSAFLNAIKFYKQIGLVKEKWKVTQCIVTLTESITKLNTSQRKVTIKNSSSSTEIKPYCNKDTLLPIRYTRTFFQSISSPKNSAKQIDIQHSLSH